MKTNKHTLKEPKIKSLTKICLGAGAIALICAAAPTTGQYASDVTQVQTNNVAQDAVMQVNEILCIIQNTNFSQYTNQGPRLAMVNQRMCETSGNAGEQSNGTNTNVPKYMNIIFDTTRANANSPQLAKFWITANMGDDTNPMSVNINASLTVNETPTTDNPYGIFDFTYAGYPEGDFSNDPLMKGYIQSARQANNTVQLQFYEEEPDSGGAPSQVVIIGAGTAAGYGQVLMPDRQQDNTNLALTMAYDSDGLLVVPQGQSNICYNRNDLSTQVYQYGVYDSAGGRLIHANAGYPFTYNGNQGFLSYYGPSLPGGVTPSNGDAVTYSDAAGASQAGTFVVKDGKMSQFVPQNITLSEMSGVPINAPSMGNGGMMSTNAVIAWNSSSQAFEQIASQTCNDRGCTTTAQTPTPYGQSQFQNNVQVSGQGTGTVGLWINGVGNAGNTQLPLFSGCTYSQMGQPATCSTYNAPSNATSMLVWNNSLLSPTTSGAASTYYCVTNCPYQLNGAWAFANPGFDNSLGATHYITYTFDPVAYTLTGTSGVANGQTISVSGQLQQPLMTGPLLTQAQYNSILSNGVPNMAKLYDGTVSSYLQWQSGDSYNRYIGINDSSNNPLPLSAPLQLTYTNPSGSKNFLQYSGFGNLQGIPGTCLDQNGDAVSDCSGSGTRWVPAFNIPSGAPLTDNNGNTYWVKQLFTAQSMNKDSSQAVCSGLDVMVGLANSLTLPTIAGWVNPTTVIGIAPVITEVSVINGISN